MKLCSMMYGCAADAHLLKNKVLANMVDYRR